MKYKVLVRVSDAGDTEEHVIDAERVEQGSDMVTFTSGSNANNYRVHFSVPKSRLVYLIEQKQG